MLQNKDSKFITISGYQIVNVDPNVFTKTTKTFLNSIFLVQHCFVDTISTHFSKYLI